MAKIRTYETVTTPAAGDIVIGTDISDDNATKNFDVQDIANLADTPTLNEVLGAGNTSALNITLAGSATLTSPNLTVTANALLTNLEVASAFRDSTSSTGTAGQVLSSTGTATQWINAIADDQDLDDVLTQGNTSGQDITLSGTATITSPSIVCNNLTSNLQLTVSGTLVDSTSSTGTSGQLLSSTGTATQWVDASTYIQDLDSVLTQGNTSASQSIILTSGGLSVGGTARFNGAIEDNGGGSGTSGQVLSSTGTGVDWITLEDTFDVAHEIVGFSTAATQGPSALDTSYTVEFGAAQGSGATASQLSAAGVVTFNEAGIYRIDVQLATHRPSGTGDAFLVIAPYLDGSQYGFSSVITFIPSQAQWQPWNYSAVVEVAATDTFSIRIARDGGGTNEGGLRRFSTNTGSPFTGPGTAQIRIQQLKNV